MRKKFYILISISFILISAAHAQCPDGSITSKENLVRNGDFSQGNNFFESDYKYELNTICAEPHWLPEGMYSILPSPTMAHCNFADCRDHTFGNSNMLVVNGATIPNQVIWKQKVSVNPNTTYYFSTWICNAVGSAPSKMEFSINGKPLGTPIVAPEKTCEWKQFFTLWNSENNSEAVISIVNQNTISLGNDFVLDDIVFYTCEKPDFKRQLGTATIGSIIELRNVFFDFGKDQLRQDSNPQLNELLNYLSAHPSCEIEIRGHTDSVGSDVDNQKLSERRAKAVYTFLTGKGVNASRIKFAGFGETEPIDSNDTFEGQQKNRRVEFKIIKQ